MSVSYGGDSITFADGSVNSSGFIGHRNRIINGAMVIDQRNVGASIAANSIYSVDRWLGISDTSNKWTVQQNAGSVTPPAGFTNYLGCTSSSAYTPISTDYFGPNQRIEGYNIADLNWGSAAASSITLSFWVRSSLTGSFGGSIQNSSQNRSYAFPYTILSANTWEYKTVTIAGDTSGTWLTTNGIGFVVHFSLGAGSSRVGTASTWTGTSNVFAPTGSVNVVSTNGATFYITGVQLERGSTASSFEYRPYGTELTLCERYYEKSYSVGTPPGTNGGLAGFCSTATSTGATSELSGIRFRTRKRDTPSITIYQAVNGTSGQVYRVGDAASVNVSAVNHIGETGIGFLQLASGSANGYYWHYAASIEL